MVKLKLLFNKFLKWEVTEKELRTVLLEETVKSPKLTYTLTQTVSRNWFLCEKSKVLLVGARAHITGQLLRGGESVTINDFISRPMLLVQECKPIGY